jgi:hypothetical protein
VRAVRLLLMLAGVAAAGYGAGLLRPQFSAALPWLLGGPLLHDLLVAPVVAVVGLLLGRLVADRARRAWLGAGLAVTATLLLVAAPLVWRPTPAPPNPGLQDADHLPGLLVWLALLWTGIALRCLLRQPARRPGAADDAEK